MNGSSWVTWAAAIGLPVLITTLISTWTTRKNLGAQTDKLGTEATKILTEAAGGIVDRVDQDNTRLRAEVAGVRAELYACQVRQRALENHVIEWGLWADQMASAVKRGDKTFRKPRPRLPA